MESSMPSKPQH